MDESEAVDQQGLGAATPIFSVYRRGYDPEQVDRYVADQQRRLDETTHRASESERKLAAAVGQLRELHRRVATYESEARSTQPPALDTLGERVQRILQEAWEGAYNLRQEAEREVNELKEQTQRDVDAQREQAEADVEELRQVASKEAADLVDEATQRALALRDEMDRRRAVYLEKVERDRQKAVSQITYLYDQRQMALSELARLQANVQATVEEMVRSPLGKPSAAIADSVAMREMRAEAMAAPERAFEPAFAPAVAEDIADEMAAEMAMGTGAAIDGAVGGDAYAEADREAGAGYADQEYVEEPDARAAGEWLAGSPQAGAWDPDETMASPAHEIPTGPMNAVDYGYDYSSYTRRPAHAQSAPAPAEAAEPAEPGTREYGGVYDADVDGWG